MCTGGFTSKTSKEALRCKAKYSAFDEIERLNKRIVLLENNIDDYKSKYIRASRELQEFKNANKLIAKLSENYPHLLQHINSLNLLNDSPKVKNGNRFNPMLESVYSLISTSGEYTMSLLHKYFGFPCMGTCRNKRDRIKAKYRINENILNGSFESIQKLIQLFWKSTAINSKITIHKDGQIEGLLRDISIDTDLIDLITSNSDAFYAFYKLHQDEIIKYYFVFYVCSLSEENKSFPIFVKRTTSGSANDEVTSDLEELVFLCRDAGLDAVEVSFDGDPSYLKYINEMCNEIERLPTLDLKSSLSNLFKDYYGILAFEDMYHLTKCCRYRLVCGSYICPLLSNDTATFNVEDFKALGIKDYILDKSKTKKKWTTTCHFCFSQQKIFKQQLNWKGMIWYWDYYHAIYYSVQFYHRI